MASARVVRVKALLAATASHAALFVLLLEQALGGQSVTSPDATTLLAIAAWATLTVLVAGLIAAGRRRAEFTAANL